MQGFFYRFALVLVLFFLQAFWQAAFLRWGDALQIVLIAVILWTIILGFRSSLIITLPILLLNDIFLDGARGRPLFFQFALVVLVAFLSVRIEKSARLLTFSIYAALVATTILLEQKGWWAPYGIADAAQWLRTLLLSFVLFPLIRGLIVWVEQKLDTSYRKAAEKIR
jgi:hypothetical protein